MQTVRPGYGFSCSGISRPALVVGLGLSMLVALTVAALVYSYVAVPPKRPTLAAHPAEDPQQRQAQLAEEVLLRCQGLLSQNQPQQAIEVMEAYVQAFPSDERVRPLLAQTYLEEGQLAKGESVADDCLRLDPNHRRANWAKAEALRLSGKDSFLPYYQRAAQAPSDGETLIRVGLSLVALDRLDEAEPILDRGMREQPDRPDALAARAQIYFAKGQYESAEEMLQRLVARNPDNFLLYERLGRVRLLEGKPGPALAAYQKSMDLKNTGGAALGLGDVYALLAEKQSDPAERAKVYEKSAYWAWRATAFEGTRAEGNFKAAQARYLLGGQGNYQKAERFIAAAAEATPDDTRVTQLRERIELALQAAPTTAPTTKPWLPGGLAGPAEPTTRPAEVSSEPALRFEMK